MVNAFKLPKEHKEDIVSSVQEYAELEWSQELGRLGAEQFVDFMLAKLGPVVYNQAIEDARRVLTERTAALEDELYALEKPIRTDRR